MPALFQPSLILQAQRPSVRLSTLEHGERQPALLSLQTLRRSTSIGTTADVPFRALVFGDRMELGVTLWPRG